LLGVFAGQARADTSTLAADAPLPWGEPTHHSPFETLVGPIASTVANRSVNVRCEGDFDSSLLATQGASDPRFELGFVGFRFYKSSGAIYDIADFAELSPTVCSALQQFAIAATKPTKCTSLVEQTTTTTSFRPKRVAIRVRVTRLVHGALTKVWAKRWKTVLERVSTSATTSTPGQPAPCYDAAGALGNSQDAAYWSEYTRYALGILALAHESIHLGGYVGGTLSNGTQAGYADAEARAQCYGMQWMPYVAQQLGASPDDALAIARFTYARIFPLYKANPPYWSSECRPDGTLDLHHTGAAIWS
jgi:hypothetical protein